MSPLPAICRPVFEASAAGAGDHHRDAVDAMDPRRLGIRMSEDDGVVEQRAVAFAHAVECLHERRRSRP